MDMYSMRHCRHPPCQKSASMLLYLFSTLDVLHKWISFAFTTVSTLGTKKTLAKKLSCKSPQKCPLCKVMRSLLEAAAGRYFTVTMAVNSQDSAVNCARNVYHDVYTIVYNCTLLSARNKYFLHIEVISRFHFFAGSCPVLKDHNLRHH